MSQPCRPVLAAGVAAVLCVLVVSGCARSMMATPVLYRVAPSLAFEGLPEALRGNRIEVLFVTDREPAGAGGGRSRFYGSDRSASAAFGVAEVVFGGLAPDLTGIDDDALVAAGEFWHFLGREGVPIIYTWPSGAGGLNFYTADRESGEFTILFRSRQRLGAVSLDDLGPRKRRIIERIDNLDIIVYEGGGGGFYRHGYFRDPVASSDMILLLRYDLGPGEERRDALERIDPRMWRLRD